MVAAWPFVVGAYVAWIFLPKLLWLPGWLGQVATLVWGAGLICGLFAVPIIASMLAGLVRRRGSRRVRAAQFRMCLECRYRLDGLGDIGRCPECGRIFSTAELREGWCVAYPDLDALRELCNEADETRDRGGVVLGVRR